MLVIHLDVAPQRLGPEHLVAYRTGLHFQDLVLGLQFQLLYLLPLVGAFVLL